MPATSWRSRSLRRPRRLPAGCAISCWSATDGRRTAISTPATRKRSSRFRCTITLITLRLPRRSKSRTIPRIGVTLTTGRPITRASSRPTGTCKASGPGEKGLMQRLFLTLFFTALLVAIVVLDRASTAGRAAGGDALERYGFRLEDGSARAGMTFVHHGPVFDARLEGIMPIVAATGASVSVTDVDRDGWQDVYLSDSAIGSRNRLFRNNRDGTFTDIADAMGVADVNRDGTGVSMGTVWGDYDNDGYE